MELNDIRSLVTLLGFVLFTGLAVWTWWPTRHAALDAAAQLPFEGDAAVQAPTKTHTTATGPGEPS